MIVQATLHASERSELDAQEVARDYTIDDQTFPEMFELQVAATPNAVAAEYYGDRLTYEELNARANQIAHMIASRGWGPEDVVAFSVPRSLDMLVVVLGILKSGAAYLPLDPTYPTERLAFMVRDSAARCLLTVSRLEDAFQVESEVICIDAPAFAQALGGAPESNPSAEMRTRVISPYNPAYVIYTSGSTGAPKGVVVPHAGLASLAQSQRKRLAVDTAPCVLQFVSISFDAAMFELCLALLNGGRLILASANDMLPGPDLVKLMERTGVTHAGIPPSALAMLPYDGVAALKVLIVFGEVCQPRLVERWSQRCAMINGYGPTECTVCTTLSDPLTAGLQLLPLGQPVDRTTLLVLDDELSRTPVGVPGELYIAGRSVVRGYLRQPRMTAERFVANPFGQPGSRMYRSGDTVVRLENGDIVFWGRRDDQVKVRGFRVELGEVEAAIVRHPAVLHAAVVVREPGTEMSQLAAYYVLSGESRVTSGQLRQYLAAFLPAYMMPAVFLLLPALPVSRTGKLDKAALPTLPFGAPISLDGNAPTQSVVTAIFSEVLGLDEAEIDVHQSFFDLGGHSLSAIRMMNRLRERFPTDITLEDIFEASSVIDIAMRLQPSD